MSPLPSQPKKNFANGFTLVEVLVSLIIFSVVVVMAVGAVFSLVNAGEKARSLNSVMGNLNVALETMADTVRFGTGYQNWDTISAYSGSCVSGTQSQALYLVPAPNSVITSPTGANGGGGLGVTGLVYGLDNNQIVERIGYGNNATGQWSSIIPVTANEVHVTNLSFWVYDCNAIAPLQPYVLMSVSGYAETRQNDKVNFNIQTTMTAR